MIDQALNAMQHGFPFSHAVLKYAMESYDLKMSRLLRFCQELSRFTGFALPGLRFLTAFGMTRLIEEYRWVAGRRKAPPCNPPLFYLERVSFRTRSCG